MPGILLGLDSRIASCEKSGKISVVDKLPKEFAEFVKNVA